MSATATAERLPATIRTSSRPDESRAMRLVSAVQALSLARDLNSIVEIVRRSARAIAEADGATFVLREGDQCHYVDEDAIGPLWKGQRFPLSSCISGWVMLNGRAAMVPDITVDARLPQDAYRPTFVKSLVMAPVRAESPIGAIGIYWARFHTATDEEVELLQALASSTAVAMENVLLYHLLEKRVAERTQQLEDINRELETFSYSVSHDLQAPLRHITAYSELLTANHPEVLDEESRAWLGRIQKSATTMSELIQALLRLARYTRTELMLAKVDLSAMARAHVEQLRQEAPTRRAEFEIEPGLQVRGDESLLRVVMQNLLANAWKFTSRRETAHIQVGSTLQPDGTRAYFVRDDGAGFNMQYATKLFAPFHRLHGVKEFEGTGVGLATVKRIIHRHGGVIWADAAVDKGATFYFTLKDETPVKDDFAALRDSSA